MARADVEAEFDAANVLASLASHSPPPTHNAGSPPPMQVDAYPFSNPYGTGAENKQDSVLHAASSASDEQLNLMGTSRMANVEDRAMDEATAETIAAMGSEYNTRVRKPTAKAGSLTVKPDLGGLDLASRAPSKKRAAPKSGSPGGIQKPAAKKRKSEALSDRATPVSSRHSPTPSATYGRPASKTPVPSKRSKSVKTASSPVEPESPSAASDVSDGSDTAIYCICRKPDNHTWMIGCDGPCGDWFHGKCVSMQKENQALVDKYICPNCEAAGSGVTTWKPMCRADGCRKPAVLKKGAESKYCSRDCGLKFMKMSLARAAGQLDPSLNKKKSRTVFSEQDTGQHPRISGALRDDQIKALADHAVDIEEFRRMGTAPHLDNGSIQVRDTGNPADRMEEDVQFAPAERERLVSIAEMKAQLREKRLLLKDRGTFIAMMRARVPKIAEMLKKKERDVCGFDPLWSMDDANFAIWRNGEEGRVVFANGVLDVPKDIGESLKKVEDGDEANLLIISEDPRAICLRKAKCNRHGNAWSKLVLDDVRFESSQVATKMRQIDTEEREIRQSAERRMREKGQPPSDQLDGWVEVVKEAKLEESITIPITDGEAIVKVEEDIAPAAVT